METEKQQAEKILEGIKELQNQGQPVKQRTEEELNKIAQDGYYKKPEMVRFLMIENLALKTILAEKGIITPEEFDKFVEKAADILDIKVKDHIEEWKQNSAFGVLFDVLKKK